MAKPHPKEIVDQDDKVGKRKFKCGAQNTLFIHGTDFDDDATVELSDSKASHSWVNPPDEVKVVAHGKKLKVKARLECHENEKEEKSDFFSIGQLTATVTNPGTTPESTPVTQTADYS